MKPRARRWSIGCGATAVALVVAVFLANLWPESDLVEHRVSSPYGVEDPQFVRAMSSLLGPALLEGNSITELTNGEEAFPAMLAAIAHARHSITFETYIYWEGEIGARFAAALAERARSGVRVHVLLDWVGSQKMDDHGLAELRRAGAEVVLYRRPRWHNLGELNERTHRKLIVDDLWVSVGSTNLDYRSFRYNDEATSTCTMPASPGVRARCWTPIARGRAK